MEGSLTFANGARFHCPKSLDFPISGICPIKQNQILQPLEVDYVALLSQGHILGGKLRLEYPINISKCRYKSIKNSGSRLLIRLSGSLPKRLDDTLTTLVSGERWC
jgi:hypothetical protein